MRRGAFAIARGSRARRCLVYERTMKKSSLLCVWLLVCLFASFGPGARAARGDCVDDRVIARFPRDVAEFACANLDSVKTLPWFNDFKGQVLPSELYGFDQFLVAAGVNPNTQVKQIAWAIGSPTRGAAGGSAQPDASEFLAVLAGDFDPDSMDAALDSRGLATRTFEDRTLYPIGTGGRAANLYFMAIDSDSAAVGTPAMLAAMIRVERGEAESLLANQPFVDLIEKADGDAAFWGVFNGAGTRSAITQLAPGAAQYAQSDKLFQDLRSLILTADAKDSGVALRFHIETDSATDSVLLSQILQAAVVARKYIAKSATPPNAALAAALDKVSVTPQSVVVDVAIDLPTDQLRDLLLQRTFAGD
jgi:hypothetical protein